MKALPSNPFINRFQANVFLSLSLLLSISAPTAAFSDSDPSTSSSSLDSPTSAQNPTVSPVLGGHSFLKNSVTDFPFVATRVSGQAALTADASQIREPLTGEIALGRLGIDIGTLGNVLLSGPVQYGYGFSTGVKYEAIKSSRWILTPALFYSIQEMAQSQPGQYADFGDKTGSQTIQPSLLSAISLSHFVGITPEVAVRYTNATNPGSSTMSSSETDAIAGATLDLNCMNDSNIPFGLEASLLEQIAFQQQGVSPGFQGGIGFFARVKKEEDFSFEILRGVDSSPTEQFAFALSATAYF